MGMEVHEEQAVEKAEQLKAKFKGRFLHFGYSVHGLR